MLFFLSALIFIGLSIPAAAQNINTVAGNGSAAFGGDAGPATAAQLNTPYAVATDAHGNVYIADQSNNRIRKIDVATGVISTIAGTGVGDWAGDGGLATAAHIQSPRAIVVDDTGAIVFTDYGNNCIRIIDTFGYIHPFIGMHGAPGFSGDGGPATAAVLSFAWGIARDHSNNYYVADQNNNRIRKVNAGGIISTIAGTGIAFYGGDGGPATAAKVQGPTGVAADQAGNIYIADNGNNRIRKITSAGVISTIAGSATYGFTGDGGPSTAARLYYPRAVFVDISGNIYISDLNNYRVRRINSLGVISTVVGNGTAGFAGDGGPATAAEIDQSSGVCVDFSGNLYVCDNANNRIRKISANIHAPVFVGGHMQYVTACEGVELINLDSLLAASDIDTGQSETWSLISGPSHGTVAAAYSTLSTGGTMLPASLGYVPATSYSGLDSFKVRITDGTASDTTTIFVNLLPPPSAGVITGIDSVCPGDTVRVADTTTGGVWGMSNTHATISATGLVTGVSAGMDTVIYTWTGQCGTATTTFPMLIRSVGCPNGLDDPHTEGSDVIKVYPEPSKGIVNCLVKTAANERVRLVVTNVMGAKVNEFSIMSNRNVALGIDAPAGVYYVTAYTGNQKFSTKITIVK